MEIIPLHIQMLLNQVIQELEYMVEVENGLKSSMPERLMIYSKEAFSNMFTEVQLLADDREAGYLMSKPERYLHHIRRDKWQRLLETIWIEINSRGEDTKREIIEHTLNNNPLYQQYRISQRN